MTHWSIDDIPWGQFDASKVDPELVCIIKAASLVEYNGSDYVRYLCNVFHDDETFQGIARNWGVEEVQHGAVLGRWAKLADPTFDFEAAFKRFLDGYKLELDVEASIRGSRSGELIARCIVETGTSSYYTALGEATEEPVLKEICRRIAIDELRHYKTFYTALRTYLGREGLGFWGRLRVAAGRVAESEDDELAYAYYAANQPPGPYDRKQCNQAYARRAFAAYRPRHVNRAMSMVFKAVGLKPHGHLNQVANRIAWFAIWNRARRLAKKVA
jgi:hypothetical protein